MLEGLRLGIAAAELSRALSGIPSLPYNIQHSGDIYQRTSTEVSFFPDDEPANDLDLNNTWEAVNLLVNKYADPNFWEPFDENLASNNPERFWVSSRFTREDLLFPNARKVTYYPEDAIPALDVLFINPDGVDYPDPTVTLSIQIALDGTISGLRSEEDLPSIGSIPDEALEQFLETHLSTPDELKIAEWDEIEPDTLYREYLDPETGYHLFQILNRDGLFSSGFSLPPQPETTPQ